VLTERLQEFAKALAANPLELYERRRIIFWQRVNLCLVDKPVLHPAASPPAPGEVNLLDTRGLVMMPAERYT
jgi:hypothetical protein